ncbi:FAD-dependent monooxygenase [Promicromonospora sp. NPDC060204]|uniref:FAD-dependent monooxygenase n=1 Tax=Promicromonospora sp. NPDC060204 TaxID=3347071 RepID=UPI003661C42B
MRILIVGGGVAGSASAVALRRIGAQVTVVEAYEDPAGPVGSFVSLASNALRALDALGCLDRVRARGIEVERQRMWSGRGRLLADVARGRRAADPARSVTLRRAALVDELRSAAREAGAEVVTGDRLVGFDGGTATFSSGRTERPDLLVGADGIWSAARGLLDPGAPVPRYAGMYVVSGRTRAADLTATALDLRQGAFNIMFCREGAFLHVTAPDGDVWWQAQVTSAEQPDLGASAESWRARLADVYRREPGPRLAVERAVSLQGTTLQHSLAPVPMWHTDDAVLVGDAVHPVGAGQGAAMAVEDAVALAAALAEADTIPAALAGYERARRPRVSRTLRASDDNRQAKRANPLALRLQEVMMPLVVPHVFERATGWLYDYEPERLPTASAATPAEPPRA